VFIALGPTGSELI